MNPHHQPQLEGYRHARRLLVFLNWGIGDTVIQRPMLAGLRRAAPSATITAMGSQTSLEVLDDGRLADELVSYQSLGIHQYGQEESAAMDHAVRDWLQRSGPWDIIFNCRHAPVAVQHAVWLGGLHTVEPDEPREREALARGAGCQQAWVEAAAAGWGIPMHPETTLRLDPPAWARRQAEDYLETQRLSDELPAAISPVASLGLKRWPAERFAELGDRLIDTTRSALLIFAGDEPDVACDVRDRMVQRGRTVIVNRCHLLETAALLQRCRVLVCNDTGLLHIGAAVGTPVVGLHGPTSPELYRPRFPWAVALGGRQPECPHRPIDNLDLAGCWQNDTCLIGAESCINTVTLDEVWDALHTLIPLSASPTSTRAPVGTTGAPGRSAVRKETQPGPADPC